MPVKEDRITTVGDLIVCFVEGEPQPFPKKEINRTTGAVYARDPHGEKKQWVELVRLSLVRHMRNRNLLMFEKGIPLVVRFTFYRTKPKTRKDTYPSYRPDLDNFSYTVTNAMSGLIYHDDDQIVSMQSIKLWAGDTNPAGVEIIVGRAE